MEADNTYTSRAVKDPGVDEWFMMMESFRSRNWES